jgi:hypothetical protein
VQPPQASRATGWASRRRQVSSPPGVLRQAAIDQRLASFAPTACRPGGPRGQACSSAARARTDPVRSWLQPDLRPCLGRSPATSLRRVARRQSASAAGARPALEGWAWSRFPPRWGP